MPEIIGAALVVILGLLVIWWARACRRGTLPRQWIFGYRTPLTLRDKDAWIAVNRASAPFIFIAGIGAITAAVVAAILLLTEASAFGPVLLGVAVGWLFLWVLLGFFPAAAAARTYKRSTTSER